MNAFSRVTHFSIIWGVSLAVITLLEWNSLDRNPVEQEILSPFIERTMTVDVGKALAPEIGSVVEQEAAPDAVLNYTVEFRFNGPFFLACFFIPILIFHGVGILWQRLWGTST